LQNRSAELLEAATKMLFGVENASHARSSDVSGFSGRQSVMPTAEIAPVSLRCDGNDAARLATGAAIAE